MNVVSQSYKILSDISYGGIYELMDIERAARICYRSEGRIEDQGVSAKKLIKKLIESGHEAMLEQSTLSVEFTCDRAIANEIVRHRMASFAQESTRYCNYGQNKFGQEITVIEPGFDPGSKEWDIWYSLCKACEMAYMGMLESGVTPEYARSVLPLSLATKLVVTANYREWRHILKLRTDSHAHPQIRALMLPLLDDLKERIPNIFDDIYS